MAGVLNNCRRPITLNCRIKKTGTLIKHRLNPTDFKTIPDGEWNLLKKNKVVQGYLDKGDLMVGSKKHVDVPEDFEPDKNIQVINECKIGAVELLDLSGQEAVDKILSDFGCSSVDDFDEFNSSDAEACAEAFSNEIKKLK